MAKKIYIGFAIDMDRAYDLKTRDGKEIRNDHPKFADRIKHKKIFEDGMETPFEYFKSINAEKGVTWFVNEASFVTTQKFPEILKKCVDTGGELGLHTHFNSSMFKSSVYTMPENPNIWEKEGIIDPKKRLEDFLKNHNSAQTKITVFKAGNHIRNKQMFEKLVEHGFEIDTTCQINHIEIREVNDQFKILFNDSNIKGNPFVLKTCNGEIFEIPELGVLNNKRINDLINNNSDQILLRFQLHPWQVLSNNNDTLLTNINNCINHIKTLNIKIEYLNCHEMKDIYCKYNNIKYNTINTNIKLDNLNVEELKQQLIYQERGKINNILEYFYPLTDNDKLFLDTLKNKNNKIYIGINVDLDAAVNDKVNSHGQPIRDDHPQKQKKTELMNKFIKETNILLDFFEEHKCGNGVTWYVNEPAYNITKYFPDLLNKCLDMGGELGLHSHLNSKMFNSNEDYMTNNPKDWLEEGLIKPIKTLENFYGKKIKCFKGGNHVRCNALYQELVKLGIQYDNTKVIEDGRWRCNGCNGWFISENVKTCQCQVGGVTVYNDTNIEIGSTPFFIETEYGSILELPEIRVGGVRGRFAGHIKECFENDKLCFILLQTHPFDYKETLPIIRKVISACEYIGNVNYLTSNKMAQIYENSLLEKLEFKISTNYNQELLEDKATHYSGMINNNRIFGHNDIFIINYIYNNYPKNTHCLDLFAGIGQSAIALYNYGFKNIGLLEFDKYRGNLSKKICSENNYGINIIIDNFFDNQELYNYDLIFTNNAVNLSLGTNIEKQIEIYTKFLNFSTKKTIIFNPDKYGDIDNKYNIAGYKIIEKLKDNYYIQNIGHNFIQISNYKVFNYKLSDFFVDYSTINYENIETELITEKDHSFKIIQITLNKNLKHSSFGIYFSFNHKFLEKYSYNIPIQKYNFSFYAKSNKKCKLKIFTGITWLKLNEELNSEYKKIEINDIFDFKSRSKYRIGIQDLNKLENCNIYITQPNLFVYEESN